MEIWEDLLLKIRSKEREIIIIICSYFIKLLGNIVPSMVLGLESIIKIV